MVGGNDDGKTATATAMRAAAATTGGISAVGGDDDGDCGRPWRLRVMAERCMAATWTLRGAIADGVLSRRCRARARYVVGDSRNANLHSSGSPSGAITSVRGTT
jgi:hypothetical protein